MSRQLERRWNAHRRMLRQESAIAQNCGGLGIGTARPHSRPCASAALAPGAASSRDGGAVIWHTSTARSPLGWRDWRGWMATARVAAAQALDLVNEQCGAPAARTLLHGLVERRLQVCATRYNDG